MRVVDPHAAGLDAQDPIRAVAQLENVAGEAFDGEVFVDGADDLPGRLEHDLVVGVVGNRAAGGQRGQARAAPAAQHAVDRVAMHVSSAMSPARAEAFGQRAHDVEKLVARQRRVRIGAPHELEQRVLTPLLGRDLGDDLLRRARPAAWAE